MTTSSDRFPDHGLHHVIRPAKRWSMTPLTDDPHTRGTGAAEETALGGLLGLLPVRELALFAHR